MRPLKIYSCLLIEEEKNLWHKYLTQTLRKMGHDVYAPVKVGLKESWYLFSRRLMGLRRRAEVTENILNDVKRIQRQSGLDLFFAYLFPFQFTPELFKELKRLSIPSLYFFCDNFRHPEVAKRYAPYATLNWVPEKNALPRFSSSGSRSIYLPMAASPDINYPVEAEESVDISFFGTKNPYRRNLLGQVLDSGLKLRLYGDGWYQNEKTYHSLIEETKGPLPCPEPGPMGRIEACVRFKMNAFLRLICHGLGPRQRKRWFDRLGEEYDHALKEVASQRLITFPEANKIYSFSSISIGINEQFNPLLKEGVVFHTKLRDFETAMAGACYLTQATPEGPELFEEGKEVFFYSSAEELIDKARFLLKNEQLRKRLKRALLRRALSEHTWAHRFRKAFAEMGFR